MASLTFHTVGAGLREHMGGAPQASSAHTVTDCSPSTSRMAVSSSALQFLRDFDSETATCCFCEGSAKLACKVNHCVLGSNTPYCACEPCLRRDVHKAPVQVRALAAPVSDPPRLHPGSVSLSEADPHCARACR